MYLIYKKLKDFSAAHRVIKGYQGKCADLHGHNYVVGVLIGAPQLDQFDFVIDFNEVKKICDTWLEEYVDHATLVCSTDYPLIEFVICQQQKHYIIPGNLNTTAEVIAHHLFEKFEPLLKVVHPELTLLEVEVAETPNSRALYAPSR